MRISAQEREYLNEIAEHSNMSISDIMREAMRSFIGMHDQAESKGQQ